MATRPRLIAVMRAYRTEIARKSGQNHRRESRAFEGAGPMVEELAPIMVGANEFNRLEHR
jgi:hypothetical protein